MENLSISQKYLLCVLNEKGKLPALNSEAQICILAGGLLDLIFAKSVAIGEDKKLQIVGELSVEHQYLSSLYMFIKEMKPMKVDKLASEYALTFTDKRMKELIHDLGMSLTNLGYTTIKDGGLFGNTKCFIANKQALDHVVETIRAELLEEGAVTDDIVALVSLMNKSNQLEKYFSAYEKKQLKSRLKEIKKTDSNKLIQEMVDYVGIIVVIAAT